MLGKYLSIYFKFTRVLIAMIVIVGFIAPSLVSANSMILVGMGFALLLAVPPVIGVYAWHTYHYLKPAKKDTK